jgi:septum formation protein
MHKTIVLASKSPRREQLLSSIGLKFELDPAIEFQEISFEKRPAHELVLENAIGKAEEVAKRHPNSIIIGVDTVGALNDHILEKPRDEEDAFRMLKMLSGVTHEVYSGICMIDSESGKKISAYETTKISFLEIPDEDIRKYIKSGEPMDKAAAYAAQGIASIFVKSFEGDFFNVVGLPMYRLNLMFKEFDINLIDELEFNHHI